MLGYVNLMRNLNVVAAMSAVCCAQLEKPSCMHACLEAQCAATKTIVSMFSVKDSYYCGCTAVMPCSLQ